MRHKLEPLAEVLSKGNIVVLTAQECKLDDNFPLGQLQVDLLQGCDKDKSYFKDMTRIETYFKDVTRIKTYFNSSN